MATFDELLRTDPNAAFKQGASLSGEGLKTYVSRTPTPPPVNPPTDYTSRISANNNLYPEPKPVDENSVRIAKLNEAQTMVNAINAQFAPLFSEQEDYNKGQEARTRALNISSGLGGSDFASTAASETEKKGQKATRLLQDEKATKIAAVLSNAQSRADEEIRNKRTDFRLDTEAYNKRKNEIATEALQNAAVLAKQGLTAEDFKKKDPKLYEQLVKESGKDSLIFDTMFNDAKDAASKVMYQEVTKPGKNGNAVLLRYGFDPIKKQPLPVQEYDLGIPYSQVANQETKVIDGVLYGKETDGTWKALTKKKATSGETQLYLKKQAFTKARPELEKTKVNGYTDPSKYMELRTDYAEAIGSVADFDATFASMLSPTDRARLGIGKATGVEADGGGLSDMPNFD